MSLYLKYRPADLSQVKGNADVVATLEGMLKDTEKCPHSFLLHGPTGCGKTTIGRIIAKRLGCVGNDFKEIDSADFRGIDTIREIRKNSNYKAIEGRCRVWLIDECHKMTNDAQNALLKILEDTPKHVYFILCTTEPQKLLPTIKGRCIQLQVKVLGDAEMLKLLRGVVHAEEETLDEAVYKQILKSANGLPRNALQILEAVLRVSDEERLELAKQVEVEALEAIELCRALIKRAPWRDVAAVLVRLKELEPESIRRNVLGYCQSILLKGQDEPLCGLIMEEFTKPFYDSGFPQLVYACYTVTKN
jgi:DNA polymerase III subunit gamma/tau